MTESRGPSARTWERWYALLDDASPLLKQSPTIVALAIAIALTVALPDLTFDHLGWAITGAAIVVVASVWALILTVRGVGGDRWIVLLIPIVDVLGLGLFRSGTGGPTSLFAGLILLPIVWLAAAPGLRWVLVSAGLTSFALLLPYLADPPASASQWLRVIITPAIFAVAAAVVNELSRVGRERAEEAERLAAERARTIEENVRVLNELQRSEMRYHEVLEMFRSIWNATTAQAVIGTDRSGGIVAWNPGATILLGTEDIDTEYTERIERFFPVDTLDRLEAEAGSSAGRDPHDPLPVGIRALFDEADEGQTVQRELDLVREDSSRVPVRLTVNLRIDGTGEPVGYMLIATDETHAIEVARMKDEFVGMISHELRTPLSSILGYLELLKDDPGHPLSEEQLQFLGVAERNANRLLRLVGDLLFTAQVESGAFPLELRDADLATIVRASVESARPTADAAGVDLIASAPESALVLSIDPVRIGQAVDNLVSNAIKFTPRGGTVTVRLEADAVDVRLSVRDTGVGIAPDELDRLFTRFFRATTATRNAVPGVGLGLNITKAIVTAHDGRMEVESSEGVGTEFRMILPR